MNELFEERKKILDEILPIIFKIDENPSQKLIKNILIHKSIPNNLSNLNKPESIKVDVKSTIEKYTSALEIINEEAQDSKKCPLTQCAIKRPWQSVCGHTFESEAAENFIKRSKKCPVKGCNGKFEPKK